MSDYQGIQKELIKVIDARTEYFVNLQEACKSKRLIFLGSEWRMAMGNNQRTGRTMAIIINTVDKTIEYYRG